MAAKDDILAGVKKMLDDRLAGITSLVDGRQSSAGQFLAWTDGKAWLMQQNIEALARQAGVPVAKFPGPPAPATYTVAGGDTFSGIAKKLGVTPDQLGAANPQVKNRDNINVGDKLTVPKG